MLANCFVFQATGTAVALLGGFFFKPGTFENLQAKKKIQGGPLPAPRTRGALWCFFIFKTGKTISGKLTANQGNPFFSFYFFSRPPHVTRGFFWVGVFLNRTSLNEPRQCPPFLWLQPTYAGFGGVLWWFLKRFWWNFFSHCFFFFFFFRGPPFSPNVLTRGPLCGF